MSKLYGYLTGDRGTSTRASARTIESIVQTEDARITVTLTADGGYSIRIKRGDRASGYNDVVAWIDGHTTAPQPIKLVRSLSGPQTVERVDHYCVELRRSGDETDVKYARIHRGTKRDENWIDAYTLDVWEYRSCTHEEIIDRASSIAVARAAVLDVSMI